MNFSNTPQRIRWSLVIILVIVAVILMIADSTGNMETVFGFVRDPIGTILGWTSSQVNPVADFLEGPRDLETARLYIEALEEELLRLQLENEQLREIQGEHQLYEALLNRSRQTPNFERLTASVIAYNSSPYFQSIVIDAGTNDGVLVGMPVEGTRGLIGQIYRTSATASQVILVTDGLSNIPIRLGTSRATGVLRGGGLGSEMIINWLDLEAQVEIGEVVRTSGLGGRFPEDLVIGRVIEVNRRESELHQNAIVRAETDFASLEVVFVITNYEPIDTTVFETIPDEAP
jgi:rod shape-determining protein MreC